MAAPGTYLSAFVENFLRSRGLEEQRSRAEAQEAGDIFKVERYLDELGRERKAGATAADLFRRGVSPTQPVLPGAPPDWRATPSVEAPQAQPPSIAAGGAAAMQQGPTGAMPARPPVMASVLQGVAPEAAARLFTTQTGRAALSSLEQAERERRKEQDQQKAKDLFEKANDAFKRNEPAEAADLRAAAFRHVGAHDQATRWMEHSAKIRTDADEREKTKRDFAAFATAARRVDEDPSPINLAKIEEVLANSESLAGRNLAIDLAKKRIARTESKDSDIEAFLRHTVVRSVVGPNRVPIEQAWQEAMEKYPKGFGKLWLQDMMNPDKPILPEFVREFMRLPPRVGKQDQSLTQRAWFQAVQKAKEKGVVPSLDNLQFLRLWEETRLELKAADEAAGKTPEEKKKNAVDLGAAETRAEMAKLRLEAMKNPESLATKTSEELTRLIQRTNQDLKGDLTLEEERDTKAYLSLLRKYRDAKAKGESPDSGAQQGSLAPDTFDELPPADEYKGKIFRDEKTGKRMQSNGVRWIEVK